MADASTEVLLADIIGASRGRDSTNGLNHRWRLQNHRSHSIGRIVSAKRTMFSNLTNGSISSFAIVNIIVS